MLEADPDPDEAELVSFEAHCKLLKTHRYRGLEWLQVHIWLLFEDQNSSWSATVVQGFIFFMIVFSILLVLLQSLNECKWAFAPTAGIAYDDLPYCDVESEAMASSVCTRVCRARLEPFDEGATTEKTYFILDALCIAVFSLEFLLRLFSCPVTIGLRAFIKLKANWIDLVAIVPFYIDVIVMLSSPDGANGARWLAVLRVVRLTRVLRVIKFSQSLSGIVVLVRTLSSSGSAFGLIATFTILNCVLCSSLMISTPEVGKYVQENENYLREDGTPSPYGYILEVWWWCVQTVTTLGYGTPAPTTDLGKLVAMFTGMLGTVVLALPIAVVGLTFDDEWNKQAKSNSFIKVSCVSEYNRATLNCTHSILRPPPPATMREAIKRAWARFRDVGRVAPEPADVTEHDPYDMSEPSPGEDESLEEQWESLSQRGTRFTGPDHENNQAYNLQADMATLLDMHFDAIKGAAVQIMEEQNERLCRTLSTDLRVALKKHEHEKMGGRGMFRHSMKMAMAKRRLEAAGVETTPVVPVFRIGDGISRSGLALAVSLADQRSSVTRVTPIQIPPQPIQIPPQSPGVNPGLPGAMPGANAEGPQLGKTADSTGEPDMEQIDL